MDLVIFEKNKPMILAALKNGNFDYLETASEIVEADFFRFISFRSILSRISETYPSPRKKEDVPLWLYVASNLSMRLHGVNSFNAFPMIIRSGGMLNALGPEIGKKTIHPATGDLTVTCKGFNAKNHYDRESPCDSDYLRKMAKDTEASALMDWFSDDVPSIFQSKRFFDREGIFIGDGSYIFVPDNPKYEGSKVLLFDENNHPISKKAYRQLPDSKKAHCNYRRCYKMVTLLHTNRSSDFFLVVGLKILPGNAHESPVFYEMVDTFVNAVGRGVMKRLILDRGFLDGEGISKCRKTHQVDVLIPLRSNMDIYRDAMALFDLPEINWIECKEFASEQKAERLKPETIVRREEKRQKTIKQKKNETNPEDIVVKREAAVIGEFRTWSTCSVALNVVANREIYGDGRENTWLLADTRKVDNPNLAREEYHLRTEIEERYRQFKCFQDLTRFTSRAFSMIVNQVVFIFLAYNLLQIFLFHQDRKNLNSKTLPAIRRQLMPASNHIIVYYQNYYALFDPLEFVGIIANLDEEARRKVAVKSQNLRRESNGMLTNPRSP